MRVLVKPDLFGYLLVLSLLTLGGCSSWGGKLNNTEGLDHYTRGDYEQALSAFETAARLNPEDSEVYYNIASTYQRQALRYQQPALLTQAENYYRKSLEKNPSPETTVCCYRGLATVLHQKKADAEALEALRGWEERNPTSIEPKLEIAYLLEAQGRYEEAGGAFEKIAAYAPGDYRAFYKLGLVNERLGKNQAALEQMKTASRLNPSDQEIAQKIAQLETKVRAGETVAATTPAVSQENKNKNGTQVASNTAPPIQDPGWQSGRADAPPISLNPPATSTPIAQTQSVTDETLTNGSLGRTPEPPALASVPDGTGANPFHQPQPTAPPLGDAAAPAALPVASTAPTLSDTPSAPRKSRVGEMRNGPPQTSVGAPF